MSVKSIGIISTLLTLSACVTINIYFPAAEAQKAADKIIDEVWQLKEGQKPAGNPADPKAETKPNAGAEPKQGE